MPSTLKGTEPIYISGVTGGSQQLAVLEDEVNLTGSECQKYNIVTGLEAPCILGIDYLRRGYFRDPAGYWWAFGIAALAKEKIKQLSSLLEEPCVVGLLKVKEPSAGADCYHDSALAAISHQDSMTPSCPGFS